VIGTPWPWSAAASASPASDEPAKRFGTAQSTTSREADRLAATDLLLEERAPQDRPIPKSWRQDPTSGELESGEAASRERRGLHGP
jgi:hypothetical protein